MPQTALARSDSYSSVAIPPAGTPSLHLPEASISFPENPIFTTPTTIEKLPSDVVKTAHDIVRDIQTELFKESDEPVSYRGLVAARKAFESRGNDEAVRMVDTLLADQIFSQTNAFPSMESRTLCRETQTTLCTRFGVFLNLGEYNPNMGPRAAVVPETARVTANDGRTHQVIFIDSMNCNGLAGQFEPPQAIFVNKNYALEMSGKNPLSTVVVNELAHSYLTSHQFYGWANRSISLNGISPTRTTGATEALCDTMRERGYATPSELQELLSDCWSTVHSPSFDRPRLLNDALSYIARRDALHNLGKPAEADRYDLTYDVFRRFIENDLITNAHSNILAQTLDQMMTAEKKLIRIEDSLAKNPNQNREEQLFIEKAIAQSESRQARDLGIEQICQQLGDQGLERQRQTYKEFGTVLLNFIRRQPAWVD